MDYTISFENRAKNYVDAVKQHPSAFENEFKVAIDIVNLSDNDVFVNIPAGGVYLDSYVPKTLTYKRFEIQKSFAELDGVPLCTLFDIPCQSNSVNKILTLACLHHASNEERILFYVECLRILKTGGSVVVGDVLLGSEQDTWLNQVVNKYNSKGHCGVFFTEADAEIMKDVGFSVKTIIKEYTWNFSSDDEMVLFFKQLMNLDLLDDLNVLKDLLYKTFKIVNHCVEWKLIYFICTKPYTRNTSGESFEKMPI